MIKTTEVFPIGKVNKPHGINGEMSFTFTTDVFDTEEASYFIFEMEGILVPFFIESYRFRTESTALLTLNGIESEEAAKEFSGKTIYLPNSFQEKVEESEITIEYFIGFEAIDETEGSLGIISSIDQTTENVLFVIEKNDDDLLIPASDDFITEIDHEEKKIYMQIPEGLLDL